MTITAKPIRHKDIKDREIYYVMFENNFGIKHHISVGKGTVEKLEEMLKEPIPKEPTPDNQPELPLNINLNEMVDEKDNGGHRNRRNIKP